MQTIIDILVKNSVIVELIADNYSDLYNSLRYNTLLYNPSTNELSTYNLLREGIKSYYTNIEPNPDILELYMCCEELNEIDFEAKCKLVLSNYIVYIFGSFNKYCLRNNKMRVSMHTFGSISKCIMDNDDDITETTNLENIYVLMLSIDEQDYHKYSIGMLSNLSEETKEEVSCGFPTYDLSPMHYGSVDYFAFTLKSTGSYI